ncbi:hypothetical protein JCM11641_001509 [Rhodosporidiobolus odoratus]
MSHLPPYRNAEAEAAINSNLEPRRRKAKKHPLRVGDEFTLRGPSLRSDAYPTTTSTHGESTAGNRRRSFNHFLLNLLHHGPEDEQRVLVLKKSLQSGKDEWSQVWQADVISEGVREPVVLKLFVEALFPYAGENGGRIWRTGEDYAAAEGDSYAAFSDIQGSVVPVCYGVYTFKLPFGETAIGILLEDLTSVARTFSDWIARLSRDNTRRDQSHQGITPDSGSEASSIDSSELDSDEEKENIKLEDVKRPLDGIFAALDVLHDRSRVRLRLEPTDILVDMQAPNEVDIVLIGFSQTRPRAEHEQEFEALRLERIQEFGEDKMRFMSWRTADRQRLEVAMEGTLVFATVAAWKGMPE